MAQSTHDSMVAVQCCKNRAETRGDTLVDKVNAQVDRIKAQTKLMDAEYYSHQRCPRILEINAYGNKRKEQLQNMKQLQNRLMGAGLEDMRRNYGEKGVDAYNRSVDVVKNLNW